MIFAAATLALSGLLHLIAVFTGAPIYMAVAAVLYVALAYALSKDLRSIAWLVFLIMLVGVSVALGLAFTPGALGVVFAAIAALDLITAAVLFVVLWRQPDPADAY